MLGAIMTICYLFVVWLGAAGGYCLIVRYIIIYNIYIYAVEVGIPPVFVLI